jgi:hypothetical protein
MTAFVSVLLKSLASPDMIPFSLCNKKTLSIRRKNRPSFQRHYRLYLTTWEVGRAKDLSAPPRIPTIQSIILT